MRFTVDEITEIRGAVECTIFEMIRIQSETLDEKDIAAIGKDIKKQQKLHTKIQDWYHEELLREEKMSNNEKILRDLDEALDIIANSDATDYYKEEMPKIAHKAKDYFLCEDAIKIKKGYEVISSIIGSARNLKKEGK